ncbi:hypothetical protein IHE45_03G016400 [Dioscorea alata]|uniref:Uncharacterized protein n=1 Tax=Dioscorea alata TaxID=55571 RepID=A0ACB7WIZ4_DIOAL|nr:hypothetical protein IHE45_03G016400 [Dioscorea alata]
MRTLTSIGSQEISQGPSMSTQMAHHQQPNSGWHSPVPYLFAGLAAMLGLIAFALLILACSYWKLSGFLESQETDTEDQQKESDNNNKVISNQFELKHVVVIMAGEEKPTFLATPMSSRASSFEDRISEENHKKSASHEESHEHS